MGPMGPRGLGPIALPIALPIGLPIGIILDWLLALESYQIGSAASAAGSWAGRVLGRTGLV